MATYTKIAGLVILALAALSFSQTDTSQLYMTRSLSHDTVYFEGADAFGPYNTRSTVTLHGIATNDTLFLGQKFDIIFVTDNSGSMGSRSAGMRDWTDTCSRIQGAYNAVANFIDSFANAGMRIGLMYFSGVVGTSYPLGNDFNLAKAKADTFINGTQMVNGTTYGGTAIYSGIHDAVRYIAANYRKTEGGAIPVVIALTDGDDNASGEWGTATCAANYGYCWPSLQPNLGVVEVAAVDSVISVIDSVRGQGVDLRVYTINLGLQDVNNYLHDIATAGAGRWAYSNSGADLSPIFRDFWSDIIDITAVKISTSTPMIVDVLGPDIHFVAGTYGAVTASGYVVPTNFSVTNVGGYQVLSFSIDTIKLNEEFEVHYDITAARTTLSGGPVERKRVNNAISDDAVNYSRMQYINMVNQTVTKPLGRSYIYVRSLTDGIYLSTTPGAFTDPGQVISLPFNQYDTATYGPTTLYPLLLQRGTGIMQYTQVPATWNFTPMPGWVTNPSGGLNNALGSFQSLGLTIAGNNTLDGQRTLTISYNDGMATFMDSIGFDANYIAFDESVTVTGVTQLAATQVTATSQFLTTLTITGNYDQLATLPHILYSIGYTNYENFWAIDAQWSASGFTAYNFSNIFSGVANSKTITLNNAQIPAKTNTPVNDAGVITITYTPPAPAGQVKTASFNLIIRDTTDYDTADVVVITQYQDYLNQGNKDILYNQAGVVAAFPSASDTLKLVGLIFDINVSGPHFVGNAAVPFSSTPLTWYVNGTIRPSTGGADPMLRLTNVPGQKDTVVAVYGGIRDTLIVTWGFGTQRILHIETAAATLNTNTPVLDIAAITMPINIQSDSLYGVIRDEFGYAVTNAAIERWSFADVSAYTYLSIPASDVSTNECVITKISTPGGSLPPTYLLIATLNAQPIAGVNAPTQYDTVALTLVNYSFVKVTIYADSSNSYTSLYETGIVNTQGTEYRQEPIPAGDTILLTALKDTVRLRAKQANDLNPGSDQFSLSVQWTASDYSWCAASLFNQNNTVTLMPTRSASGIVTLVSRFDTSSSGLNPLLDTVFLRIAPPEIANFTISYPTTPVVAGQPAPVVISAVDKNGNVITDPTRTTPSTMCFTVDTTTIVQMGGVFDTLYAGQNNCMANPFTNGVFSADFFTFVSGDNEVDVSISYGNGQTFNGSFTLNIVPDVPNSIVIVKRGDLDSTPVLIDTLSSFGTADETSQWYVALLYDRYGNLITNQTVTSRVGWSVANLPPNLNIVGNEAMYNAANLTSGGLGTITITYSYGGVNVSGTFQIAVIPLVGVAMVSTHEWVPDTISGVSEIQDVLTNVYGVNIAAVQPVEYPTYSYNGALIKKLESFGFMPYRDGYLDYLNIVMSDTFTLLDKHIAGVNFRFNSATGVPDTIYWADSLINTSTGATIQRMKVQALSLDKKQYRLWLVPNSHRNSLLETGLKPAIVFNNGNVTHTMVRIGNGSTFARTVQDSTRDSAAPVIHRFLYKNNICNTSVTTNEAKIAFSEPIDWAQAPDVHSIYSFTLINGTAKDSTFLHSTSVTVSGANAIEALDDQLAWNYNKNETSKLMTYRIEVAQGADQKFQIGSTRLRFSVNPADLMFKDLSGNAATLKDNRQVVLEAEGVQQTVCGFNGPTTVPRYEAMNYSWRTDPTTLEDVPNFPFFGFTVNLRTVTNNSTDFILVTPGGVTNPIATNGYFYGYSLDTNKVLVTASATIYDVFGNSVASPATNTNLSRGFRVGDLVTATDYSNIGSLDSAAIDSQYIWIRAIEPGAPDTLRPKLNSTVTIGYDYIMQRCNPRTTTEICVPAWNCLNAKGRLVAPGGYIATVSVLSPGNETTEVRKLIVTSGGSREVGIGF